MLGGPQWRIARSRSAIVRTAVNLTLALLSTVLTVVMLDAVLRISAMVAPRRGAVQPVPDTHALTDWIDVFPPGYTGILSGRDFSVTVKTGALGLRERDLDLDALAREHPILFLGDSYFFGWGVEQPERISERFAARMADTGHAVPVVNFSFPGWSTYHYLSVWRRFVPRLKPRLVVMSLFVGNDFTDNLKQAGRDDAGGNRHVAGGGQPAGPMARASLAAREVIATSPMVSLLNHALWRVPAFRRLFNGLEIRNDRIALYEVARSEYQSALYAATEAAFDGVARLSKEDDVPVLVVLIPDHLQVLMPELLRGYAFDQPQRTVESWLAARGLSSLDLLPLFQALPAPDAMFFREDKHWTAQGHAFVAEALRQRVSAVEAAALRQGPSSDTR